MPSLNDVLANIPGMAGYYANRQRRQVEEMDELRQVSTLAQLHGQMQAQAEKQKAAQREGQYRAEVAALGPNPTQEQLVTIASRFGGPEKVMDVHQKSLDRRNAVEIAAASRNPPADNRPEILRLIEIHDGLPEGHPNRERILGRITYLNEGRPPAEKEAWGEPYELGGAWVQRSDKGNVRQVVGRAPQTRVDVPAPVTAVTIQDPNDPNGTIIIDGRTRQVLGKGPKLTDRGKMDEKRAFQMEGLGLALQKAEDLLMGQRRDSEGNITPGSRPTGSGIGSVVDTVGGWAGVSMPGAAEAADLRVVAGQLISKVPRFEGPQSDKDTALYRQMAAEAGNEKTPIATRLSAVRKMREVYGRYERGESGRLAGETAAQTRQPGAQLGAPRPRNVLDEADAILRGGR